MDIPLIFIHIVHELPFESVALHTLLILLKAIFYYSARFIRHLSNKNSFEGIWFLTFIIYKFIADACFGILRCQKVNNGRPNEYVSFADI